MQNTITKTHTLLRLDGTVVRGDGGYLVELSAEVDRQGLIRMIDSEGREVYPFSCAEEIELVGRIFLEAAKLIDEGA